MLYRIPAGWRKAAAAPAGWIYLEPADKPAGSLYHVKISLGIDLAGKSVKDVLDADTEVVKKGSSFHELGPVKPLKTAWGAAGLQTIHHARMQFIEQFWLVAYLPAGDRVHTVVIVSESKETGKHYQPAADALLDGLRFTNIEVVADGKAKLTLQRVYDFTDFFEWLLAVPLTPTQRGAIRDFLAEAWKQDQPAAEALLAAIEGTRREVDGLPAGERDALRKTAAPLIAGQLRQGSGPAKMLADVYDAAHKPLAAGDPPLTRQAVDANLEMIFFMASQVAGVPAASPNAEQRDKWAGELAQRFAAMTEEQRKNVAMMPLLWAATQANWPATPEAERERLKREWAGIENVAKVAAELKQAREEALKRAAAAGIDPKSNDFLKAGHALQMERMRTQFISNMMAAQHQSNMAIIRNIGNTQWKYEYRYVPTRR